MTKDKKIEMQQKIIHQLEEENIQLKKMVNDNKRIIEEAERCIDVYNQSLASIEKLKEKYLQAIEDISKYKKEYTKEINRLLKTVKKNT